MVLNFGGGSIAHPPDWVPNIPGEGDIVFYVFSPLSGEGDQFRENVNLTIEHFTTLKPDLETYVRVATQKVGEQVPGSQVKKSERMTREGRDYQAVEYEAAYMGNRVHFLQHVRVDDEKAYVLTFTAQADSLPGFEEVGQHIMNSFQLNETP